MPKKYLIFIVFFLFAQYSLFGQYRFRIDSVSVDLVTNKTIISWIHLDTTNLDSIQIGIKPSITSTEITTIDTVNILDTSYIDLDPNNERNPMVKSQIYTVTGYAEFGSAPDPWVVAHNTIYLQTDLDTCTASATLSWNSYINWNFGVESYRIYSIFGNDTILEAQVSSNTLNYTKSGLLADSTYYFFVRAIAENGSSSTSNKAELFTEMPSPPDTLIGNYASLNEDENLELSFKIDQDADITKYLLYRSESLNSAFEIYDTLDNSYVEDSVLTCIDDSVFDTEKYYYKIIGVNTCDINIDTSNLISNLVIAGFDSIDASVETDKNIINQIYWHPSVPGVSETYNIYRTILEGEVTNIENLYTDTAYADDVTSLTQSQTDGEFCYYIKGTKDDNIDHHFTSNTICIIQDPIVWIPNAFTPDGKGPVENETFKPIISYASDYSYQMIIYDRWGEKIFETTDITASWDGTSNGRKVKPGVYIYYLNYADAYKRVYEKTGSVTVIYP